jgi:peptidyl-tRNA hydrolase, PTH1 family
MWIDSFLDWLKPNDDKDLPVKLIVGLGNPGSKYDETRHNIGFRILDFYAGTQGLKFEDNKKFKSLIAKGPGLILLKPQTYMNLSGTAVAKVSGFYKIPHENILVIHDDVSIEFGKIRESFNRGAGGQHGVEDIISSFGGSKNFHRLRIGIGPDPGGDKRADYVLSKFSDFEEEKLLGIFIKSLEVTSKFLITGG